ncbi:MAG: glycerol kinase [Alphaproteobacteria bacterium]|nr:MAG: glycerol kinase [Alphaproteobacteria bacterium]
MTSNAAILAIDQGTTNSRAIIFDCTGTPISVAQRELTQHFPQDGWVEHDALDILADTLQVCQTAIDTAISQGYDIQCAGITNQRETTIIWNRDTGIPIHNAIVWQDRRTAEICQSLQDQGHEQLVRDRSGLLLDPYFSASKVSWILDHVDGARGAADRGELAFGTVDSWLLWNLTGGNHRTDASNASRTALFNIHTQEWDDDLLALFNVPRSILPDVLDNCADFGTTNQFGFDLPICGMAGDQQAATFGQACFHPGMLKSTYGTGCFALLNTGDKAVQSTNRLLSTTAWRLDGHVTYALEGSIFIAGAAIQWLRDEMGLIKTAPDSETVASDLTDNGGVYLVPAFTGLGAPWWDPDARGAIYGLTRNTGAAHITRAALESAAYQTRDLLEAMDGDWPGGVTELRVDGGMSDNNWLMQFLANITGARISRPLNTETTALGAAYLAGLQHGIWASLDDIASAWESHQVFEPNMAEPDREALLLGWDQAVQRTLTRVRTH